MMSIDWNNNETVMSYLIIWLKFLVYYYDYAHYYMIPTINYMWIMCLHWDANLFFFNFKVGVQTNQMSTSLDVKSTETQAIKILDEYYSRWCVCMPA